MLCCVVFCMSSCVVLCSEVEGRESESHPARPGQYRPYHTIPYHTYHTIPDGARPKPTHAHTHTRTHAWCWTRLALPCPCPCPCLALPCLAPPRPALLIHPSRHTYMHTYIHTYIPAVTLPFPSPPFPFPLRPLRTYHTYHTYHTIPYHTVPYHKPLLVVFTASIVPYRHSSFPSLPAFTCLHLLHFLLLLSSSAPLLRLVRRRLPHSFNPHSNG